MGQKLTWALAVEISFLVDGRLSSEPRCCKRLGLRDSSCAEMRQQPALAMTLRLLISIFTLAVPEALRGPR